MNIFLYNQWFICVLNFIYLFIVKISNNYSSKILFKFKKKCACSWRLSLFIACTLLVEKSREWYWMSFYIREASLALKQPRPGGADKQRIAGLLPGVHVDRIRFLGGNYIKPTESIPTSLYIYFFYFAFIRKLVAP